MKLFNFIKKEHPHGEAFFRFSEDYKVFNPTTDKKALIKEGYQQNVIVYRAVREIVSGISDIEIELYQGDKIIEKHDVLNLLERPNPIQGRTEFLKNVFTDYLLTGEMFIVKYPEGKPAMELWPLNPIHMDVEAGKTGIPIAYEHKVGNSKKRFPVDQKTAYSDVFMQKMYNPLDYWRGMPPLMAAALAGDTHNEGMKWNYALLANGARPDAVIEMEGDPSSETVSRLKEFFNSRHSGGKNAGRTAILTGGAKLKAHQNNARDMDYINTMKEMSKYIASAFGVPLPLIDNDASSYNNIEQAKERLWTDTILPLFSEWLNAFGNWLLKDYEGLELKANLDDIPALEGVRTRTFERMIEAVKSGIITIDEAREAIGYPVIGGLAESLFVQNNVIPIEMSGIDDMPQDGKQFDYLWGKNATTKAKK